MEGPRFQKTSQGYHSRRVENRPRFFRNKKEEIPSNHKPSKQGGQLEEGNAHCVKTSYVPCEQTKKVEAKPELALGGSRQDAVGKDQNRTSARRKDAKEYKTNFKDGERRNYPLKENSCRPFKSFHAGKPQSRTKECSTVQLNDETNMKKGQHKSENELRHVKQNDVAATQYSKPAVHVQPLQQRPEGGDLKKERSLIKNGKKFIAGQSTQQEKSEKPLPKPVQKSLVKIDDKMDNAKAGSGIAQEGSYQEGSCLEERSNLMADVQSNNLKTVPSYGSSASGLPPRLKSSQASLPSLLQMAEHQPKGPANGVVTDASVKTSDSNCHYLAKEEKPVLKMSPAIEHNEPKEPLVTAPHGELQQLKSLEPQSNEKYGYRISVDSLFSSSFFENPQVNSNGNNELLDSKGRLFENDESRKRGVDCNQAPTVDLSDNQTAYTLDETPKYSTAKTDITQANETSFLPHDKSFPSPPLATRTADIEQIENYDVRVVSPRSRSKKANESSLLTTHGSGGKFSLASPRNELLHKSDQCEVESECRTELVNDIPFGSQDINGETYKIISDHVEDTFCNGGVQNSATLFSSVKLKSAKMDVIVKGKEPTNSIQQLNPNEILKDSEKQQSKDRSGMHTSSLTDRHDEPSIDSTELPTSLYPCTRKEDMTAAYPANTNKTSHYTETQLHPSSSEMDKDTFEKQSKGSVHGDGEEMQVHQPTFSQGPYMPNPFLGHSLLTHRHAIPSAFVYPSRVGIPGGHSGFNDVGQHAGTSPSSHLFPPHGTTVCINVGGRLFEVLPSTFAAYPESLLYQIFTGATSSPINQRGHIFFDRDGYLFEIILAFARVGNLTLPPRLSLTSLINEAKFFGMYDYMFKQGQLPLESSFHFQRTTCCTLFLDVSTSKSATKVFVLQGEGKLKIESLKVSGACNLYVDLYTPSGVKETSNFLLYDSEKPNLWKAYQFCAERQLVFHLGQTNKENSLDDNNPSAQIVFVQTFVFHGDEFIP